MRTSEYGLALIRSQEGLRLHAYPDVASALARATPGARWGFGRASVIRAMLPIGTQLLSGLPWTIGYGTTRLPDSRKVMPDDECTAAEAEAWLQLQLTEYENAVRDSVTSPLNAPMFDALTSLCYNIGAQALRDSTLVRLLNERRYIEAQAEFDKWVRAGGQVNAGLVARRNAEQKLFNNGMREALADDPPMLVLFDRFVRESEAA